ncbi:MAG: Asp-tRNA(Asn)/Glu-tRNA(Gln) amidotransferase subunit GatC [Chitinispirillaceae bacterium]|nr:Asp-tRNA(Asn)/Glu-tRNA(Gln) amidotransferase subunit GatC [Chitinispirillaceae bacterium]
MIDRDTVLQVAKLARLQLSEQEIEQFTVQLGSIFEFVDQLNSVDTSAIEPTCFVEPLHDPLRDDVEQPSLLRDELLQNGPNVKQGFFAVPKVIG